jgi:hypothetical protein
VHVYVRIARFEGGDAAGADATIARIREQMESDSPPPGLEGATRVLILFDKEKGLGLGMTFFDSQEDMRRGDEALNAMSPEGSARRTSVEMYEVALDQQIS